MAFVTENLFLIAIAVFSGAMLLWPVLSGRATAGVSLDALGATRLINDENPFVVDLRDASEYAKGHLTNALNIPAAQLDGRAAEITGKRPVLFYCESGARSGRAANKMKSDGRAGVYSLAGGLQGWSGAGLPVVR
ncbi:MAG: rhodanese-like domain-containing protein [Burkholderiaceae bacterium]